VPLTGPVPEVVLTLVAAATVFLVMFTLGLAIVIRELGWIGRELAPLARGLFSVLIAVPAMAIVVARAFGLARPVEIGIVLMAISPGAPVALRNSLAAGGHRAFAPALQIIVALLAVASIPLSIELLDLVYAGAATIAPARVARQVFVAQLLPLSLGMAFRAALPALAVAIEPALARLANGMLILLAVLALVAVADVVLGAGLRIALAVATLTALALGVGHLLGGPDDGTRSAVAITSAARNPGLALLVATLNDAQPAITRAILAYLVVSALTVFSYVAWRRRAATR
jgi:bile acid:Na+ symporter, BASS family